MISVHYYMRNILYIGTILLCVFFVEVSLSKELSEQDISKAYYNSYNYEKSGNYKDAIKSLQLIYQKYGNAYGVNNRLAYLYRLDKKYKNSEFHYKKAISSLPDSLTPKLGLMYVFLQAKKYTEASKIGYQVLSIDFYNYYGNLRLAYVLRKIDNLEMTEKILIKMLVRYPSDILYLTEFGLLRYAQNDMKSAVAIFKEVLILDPENVDARTVLQSLEK